MYDQQDQRKSLGAAVYDNAQKAQALQGGPKTTQYEQLCERIAKAMSCVHQEIAMLRSTASAVLPSEVASTMNSAGRDEAVRAPEHGSPMMGFMRHIEGELTTMRQSVEDIRVRMPF